MLRYDATTIGKVVIKQGERKYNVEIRTGNCLAVFIHIYKNEECKKGECIHQLYMFFADEKHCKNILKNHDTLFGDEVVSIELNMYYETCWKLLKYMTLSGYKVKCYYKEPKIK